MRFFLLLIASLVSMCALADDVAIGTYRDDNGSKTHAVVARLEKDNQEVKCVLIHLASSLGEGQMLVGKKKLPEFVEALALTRDKFAEWSELAEKNGIKDYMKRMEVKFPSVNLYVIKNPAFNISQKPKQLFEVKNGIPRLWVFAETNTNFNRKENFSMIFSDPSQMDELINLIKDNETILRLAREETEKAEEVDSMFK